MILFSLPRPWSAPPYSLRRITGHISCISDPILLKFCMKIANSSILKLYLSAFSEKGQTKAAKAFKVQKA